MQNFFKYIESKNQKKLLFIVLNSFGEFDFLAPLVFKIMNKKEKYNVRLVVLNKGIFEQFNDCKYYKKIFMKLGVNVEKAFFSYDTNYKDLNFFFRILNTFKNIFFLILSTPQILYQIFVTDVCFIENSGKHKMSYLFHFLSKYLKKNFILFPHTSARNSEIPNTINKAKSKFLNAVPFIVTDKKEINFYKARGLKNHPLLISYPPEDNGWINLIKNNFKSPFIKEKYISIFLNGLRDEYMEPDNYYNLLNLTLECLEKTHKDYLIILKKHPRPYKTQEENIVLKKIIDEFSHLKLRFDKSPNFILSLFSRCNLILNNGAIFSSYAMNKNSFFLFLNDEGFKSWPTGRAPSSYELPCISNKNDLINILNNL